MADYIKREDAIAMINTLYPGMPRIRMLQREWRDKYRAFIECEDAIRLLPPAADVAKVRHGRWMVTNAFPHRVYCSKCYATYVPNSNWQVWQDAFGDGGLPRDYCPNCGAKMDGGENDAAD